MAKAVAVKKSTTQKKTKIEKQPAAEKPVKVAKVVQEPTVKSESKFKLIPASEAAPRVYVGRNAGNPLYPFKDMEVGIAFEIKAEADRDFFVSDTEFQSEVRSQLKTLANRLTGAVRRFTKKNEGTKFSVHTGADRIVVTRVE